MLEVFHQYQVSKFVCLIFACWGYLSPKMKAEFMGFFDRRFILVVLSIVFSTSLAEAAQQCVSLSGNYQVRVQWYNAKHVTIDNSEPWNNKLVLHKTKRKGQGRCGADAATGGQVCEGFPVDPIRTDKLRPFGDTSSCMEGTGDKFAIATCIGCSGGTQILASALGSIANLALPGSAAFQALGVVADTFGTNTSAATNALIKTTQKGLKVKAKTKIALPIHDISDLPNAENIIYVGTPKNVRLVGNFKTAIGKESTDISNKDPSYSVTIDCYHSEMDSKINNTTDTISVEWWAGNRKLAEKSHFNDITCSSKERRWTSWTAHQIPETLTHIIVKTNGSNAFYIDELNMKLWRSGQILGANLLGSSGGKDGKGWCLSKDPNDIKKSLRNYASSCKSSLRFNVAGTSANRAGTCYDLVQGKLAWNTKGSKQWGQQNLKSFCKGTKNPQKRVSCFNNLVQNGKLPWAAAAKACQKY